jgi:hypothetical protein
MNQLKLLSAGLIALAVVAGPAAAREKHMSLHVRHAHAAMRATPVNSMDCVRAPDVGSFATAPWTMPPCEPQQGY